MPSRKELVAYNRSTEEIASEIGADLVIFQTLDDLRHSVQSLSSTLTDFDCSVFTGEYVTGSVDEPYLAHLERLRADNAKLKQLGGLSTMEGKGGGGLANGNTHNVDGSASPVSPSYGADDTVGLHNSWRTN
jgi:amidophosphoribosyltransferase